MNRLSIDFEILMCKEIKGIQQKKQAKKRSVRTIIKAIGAN